MRDNRMSSRRGALGAAVFAVTMAAMAGCGEVESEQGGAGQSQELRTDFGDAIVVAKPGMDGQPTAVVRESSDGRVLARLAFGPDRLPQIEIGGKTTRLDAEAIKPAEE